MDFTLFIQPKAKNYFEKLISNDDKPKAISLGFKIAGCNGYQYVLELIDVEKANHSFSSIPFYIKEDDYKKLNNLIIDYKRDGLNQTLSYDNPNVSYECGCGESVTFK